MQVVSEVKLAACLTDLQYRELPRAGLELGTAGPAGPGLIAVALLALSHQQLR